MKDFREFSAALWQGYTRIAPPAQAIYDAVTARGETIVNDHVAFRTFEGPKMGIEVLEKHLIDLGYQRYAPYEFPGKKLRAFGYIHPVPDAPRVFLSELMVSKLSPIAAEMCRRLVDQVDPEVLKHPSVLAAGRLWEPTTFEDYERLVLESEYAGWLSAFGLCANHFTISVNHLKTLPTLEALLDFVENLGFPLNEAGGRIKGSPEVLLEQGSTLAFETHVEFAESRGEMIPSCYYEFARRYPDPKTGKLYDGFVAASADKIFHSTDRR